MTDNKERKLRKVALLCCHFARNKAYYKAGWNDEKRKELLIENELWVTINGNFMDIAVLEWCKLFGNDSEEHHWKKIADNPDDFKNSMLETIKISEDDLTKCWDKMTDYRNNFVAHLGQKKVMYIPLLEGIAHDVVKCYYAYIVKHCQSSKFLLIRLPEDSRAYDDYYKKCIREARATHDKNISV